MSVKGSCKWTNTGAILNFAPPQRTTTVDGAASGDS